MGKKNKSAKNHLAFFLSFFDKDEYAEKEVNGWWLIKHWDGNTQSWRADLYPAESFKNYARNQQLFAERKTEFIKNIKNEE